jgi:hypothetical protein
MPKLVKENQPIIVRNKNKTIVGTGRRIDQAERLKSIVISLVLPVLCRHL